MLKYDIGITYIIKSNQLLQFQFDGYNPKFETTSLPTGMNMFAIYPGELWGTSDDRMVRQTILMSNHQTFQSAQLNCNFNLGIY